MAQGFRIEEFQSKLDVMFARLPQEMEKINVVLAQTAITQIRRRLINKGETAEGKSLGKYSTRPMSALFFIGRNLGSGADKSIADYAKKNKGLISYEKVRELNNRPVDHVTLSFSGDTLNDLGITSSEVNNTRSRTVIGSLDRKSKDVVNKRGKVVGTKTTGDVLSDLDEKYGRALNTELLDVSPKEEEELAIIYDARVQRFLDEHLK